MVMCLYNIFDDGVIRMRIEITNRWTESVEVSFSNRVVAASVFKLPDWCPRSCLNIEPKHLETKAR